MKHNLMGKEKIENLGFTQVNSFENETEVTFFHLTLFSAKKTYSENLLK